MTHQGTNPSFRDIVQFLFKYHFSILLFTITTILVAVVYISVVPEKYEANSKLLVKISQEDIADSTEIIRTSGMLTTMSTAEIINSEIELLRGRHIIEAVLDKLDIDSRLVTISAPESFWQKIKYFLKAAVSHLMDLVNKVLLKFGLTQKLSEREQMILTIQNNMHADYIQNSSTINVSFEHASSDLAALIVNLAVQTFIEMRGKVHGANEDLDFFNEKTSLAKQQLELSEDDLHDYKQKWKVTAIDEQISHELSLIMELERAHDETIIELTRKAKKYELTRNQLDINNAQHNENSITSSSELLNALKIRLLELETNRNELSVKYNEDHFLITSLTETIKNIEKEIANEEIKSSIEIDNNSLRQQVAMIQNLLQQSINRLQKYNTVKYRLKRLTRQVEENEKLYNLYLKKAEEARILHEMDSAKLTNIKIIEPAYTPIIPKRLINFIPQKLLILVLSVLFGLLAGISFAITVDILDHSIKSPRDLEDKLGLTVLGTISKHKHPNTEKLISKLTDLESDPKI